MAGFVDIFAIAVFTGICAYIATCAVEWVHHNQSSPDPRPLGWGRLGLVLRRARTAVRKGSDGVHPGH